MIPLTMKQRESSAFYYMLSMNYRPEKQERKTMGLREYFDIVISQEMALGLISDNQEKSKLRRSLLRWIDWFLCHILLCGREAFYDTLQGIVLHQKVPSKHNDLDAFQCVCIWVCPYVYLFLSVSVSECVRTYICF